VAGRLAWLAGFLGLTLTALALLLSAAGPAMPGHRASGPLAFAGVCALAAAAVGWRSRSASAGTVVTWARRSRRNSGVASFGVLLWKASRWAMLRRAHV